jgi:hypothetical protein
LLKKALVTDSFVILMKPVIQQDIEPRIPACMEMTAKEQTSFFGSLPACARAG